MAGHQIRWVGLHQQAQPSPWVTRAWFHTLHREQLHTVEVQ
ncbi:MAG: hypothetical protein ACRYF3_17560 [Janthinobacterium lividum]